MPTHTHLLEIISPTGQVDFYPLEPNSKIRIGRHPDNQIVIADSDIALFQAVLSHSKNSGRFLLFSQAGETIADGQYLLPNRSLEVSEASIIQLAGYTLLVLVHKARPGRVESPSVGQNGSSLQAELTPKLGPKTPIYQEKSNPRTQPQSPQPHNSRLRSVIGFWWGLFLPVSLIFLIVFAVRSDITSFQEDMHRVFSGSTERFVQTSSQQPVGAPDFGESGLTALTFSVDSGDHSNLTYEEMFREIAPRYGLDWRLLAQLAYQESRLNPWAIGRDNDMGLMQILPSTWNEWAPRVGVTDPFDAYSNIEVAAAYLAYLRDYAQARGYHEPQWMLVGYNGGPDRLRQLFAGNGNWAQVPEKQRRYVLAILQAGVGGPSTGLDQSN